MKPKLPSFIKLFLFFIFFTNLQLLIAQESPGGVSSGMELWLKADTGVTNSGNTVTGWSDQTGNNVFTVNGNVTTNTTSLNLNNTIVFDGAGDYLTGNTAIDFKNGYAVFKMLNNGTLLSATGGTSNLGYFAKTKILLAGNNQGTYVQTDGDMGTEFHITNMDIIDGQPTENTLAFLDGASLTTSLLGGPNTMSVHNSIPYIGRSQNSGTFIDYLEGEIAEVIMYSSSHTATQRNQIQSYLALKYGITLDQTSATAYLASDGTTKMWDETVNASYNNDIFGIGRDDDSGLNQKVSKSVNSGTILTIALDADFTLVNNASGRTITHTNDKQFLVLANNGATTTIQTSELDATLGFNLRLAREWKVDATNFAENVSMKFEGYDETWSLIATADGDFSSDVTTIGTLNADGEFTTTTPPVDGLIFTLAKVQEAPGGVIANLSLWLKTDASIYSDAEITNAADNDGIAYWSDNSPNDNDFQQTATAKPIYNENANNFNPSLNFDGTQYLDATQIVGMPSGADPMLIRVVATKTTANFESGFNVMLNFGTPSNREAVYLNAHSNNELRLGYWGGLDTEAVAEDFWIQNRPYITGGTFNGTTSFVQADGKALASGTNTPDIDNSDINSKMRVGADVRSVADSHFLGNISEVIVYSADISATDQLKIDTYLALKYGISLDQSVATHYLASDGSTIWDASENTGYTNAIFGIGRDDASRLDQKISQSSNSNVLTVSLDNNFTAANSDAARTTEHSTDKQFLILANNGGSLEEDTTNEVDATQFTTRIAREWRVSTTNFTDAVNLKFSGYTGWDLYKKNASSDFSTGATKVGTLDSNGEITGITLADGDYLTLASTPDFTVVIEQADAQEDPVVTDGATFTVTFGAPIDDSTFTASDITITGVATPTVSEPTEVAPNDKTTYEFTVTGVAMFETVTATMAADVVQKLNGNNYASAAGSITTQADIANAISTITTTGAREYQTFVIDGETYLAISNYIDGSNYNLESKIYKWNGNIFNFIQDIDTNGAIDFEAFKVEGDTYLAVSNHYDNSLGTHIIDSKIYKWNASTSTFEIFQNIPTKAAVKIESFTIGSDTFIAFASQYDTANDTYENVDSNVYRWNGFNFELFQSLSVDGATDFEFFTIGSNSYLVLASSRGDSTTINNDSESEIYEWDGEQFQYLQTISNNYAFDCHVFTIGSDTYLAIANFYSNISSRDYTIDSNIYKWQNGGFVPFQDIPTFGARAWESFKVGEETYLAVANYRDDSDFVTTSKIYKINDDNTEFEEFQLIDTDGTIDIHAFNIESNTYLSLVNHIGTTPSYIYPFTVDNQVSRIPAPGGVADELVLWLKPEKGITGTTSLDEWSNQAPSPSPLSATQTVASKKPTISTDFVNFYKYIDFDGVDDELDLNSDLGIEGTSTFTNFAIATFPTADEAGAIIGTKTCDASSYGFAWDDPPSNDYLALSGCGLWAKYDVNNTIDVGELTLRSVEKTEGAVEYKLYKDGQVSQTLNADNTAYLANGFTSSDLYIGSHGNTATGGSDTHYTDINLNELIVYNRDLTTLEAQQVNSYLAIKYGKTLDNTDSYIASDGTTTFWTYDANYANSVFGIGRDDASGLDQRISKSSTSNLVTVSLNEFGTANTNITTEHTTDKQFLILANNGGSLEEDTTNEVDATQFTTRIAREWRVSTTNFTDAVNLKFSGYTGWDLYKKNASSDFSTGATKVGTLDSNGEITGITLADGDYLTLASTPDFTVVIEQADTQEDPVVADGITFKVTFGAPIDDTTFTASDITIAGVATPTISEPTEVAPNDKTTYEFTVTGVAMFETVTATMAANVVQKLDGNNYASATGGSTTQADITNAISTITTNGARGYQTFVIDGETYLTIANQYSGSSYNIQSKIYKWNGNTFTFIQDIDTNSTIDIEAFKVDGESYLAIANHYNGSSYNIQSKIYKWNGNTFTFIQGIDTNAALGIKTFKIGADTYLAVANNYDGSTHNIDSKIYKWDGSSFIEFQSIPTNSAYSWESFTIGADTYLAVANHYDGSIYNIDSMIYKWDGDDSIFREFQSIPTNGAYPWEAFKVDGDTYLAIANNHNGSTYNIDSKIYKWDGDDSIFREFQSIPTNGAFALEAFAVGSNTYLAVANHYDGSSYNTNSKIYKWNGSNFGSFQDVETTGAADWEAFTIGSNTYLAVANYKNDTPSYNIPSYIYPFTVDNQVSRSPAPGGVADELAVWFKADKGTVTETTNSTPVGDNEAVPFWYDQSPYNNYAAQGTGSNQPTLIENTTNYNAALRFDGDDLMTLEERTIGFPYNSTPRTMIGVGSNSDIASFEGWMFSYGKPEATKGNSIGRYNFDQAYWSGYASDFAMVDDVWASLGNTKIISGTYANDTANLFIDGSLGQSVDASSWNQEAQAGNGAYVGAQTNGIATWYGDINEIIMYAQELSETDRQKVDSYLAIKYGLTLDQTTGQSYLASDGSTIWDHTATGNDTYSKNIFGIGRDDASGLDQRVSKSVNENTLLTIALDNEFTLVNTDAGRTTEHTNDKQFLTVAHNDEATDLQYSELDPTSGFNTRISREWKVNATNFAQNVSMKFEGFDETWSLIGTADGDFSLDVATIGTLNADGEFTTTTPPVDGLIFTLAKSQQAPGGILADLSLWLKADDGTGVSTDAATVSTWSDKSLESNNAIASETPSFENGAGDLINYNPVVRYEAANERHVIADIDFTDSQFMVVGKPRNAAGYKSLWRDKDDSQYPFIINESDVGYFTSGFQDSGLNWSGNEIALFSAKAQPTTSPIDYYKNGGISFSTSDINTASIDYTTLGNALSVSSEAFGDIAEMVVYSTSTHTPTDIQKIESYMALKYGVTLDQTVEKDYLASDGTIVFDAPAEEANAYNHDITGIGRDDASGLYQKQSKSVNANGIMAIGLTTIEANNAANSATFANDKNFMLWANNDGTASWNATGAPAGYQVMDKKWQVQETGTVGAVTVQFDMADTDFDVPDLLEGTEYYMVYDSNDDNDLSDETPMVLSNLSGDLWATATAIDFADGAEFTLATEGIYDISGIVYYDEDGEGDLDASETVRLQDVTISLYDDNTGTSGNGVFDGDEDLLGTSQVSAATTGAYTFTGVSNGEYIIVIDAADTALNNDANNGSLTYGATTAKQIAISISGSNLTDQNFGFDEALVSLSIDETTLNEDGTVPNIADVTATVTPTTEFTTTVNLSFSGAATGGGTDYTASANSIVIPVDTATEKITITTAQDTEAEGDETVLIDIDSVTNGIEDGTQQVTTTITDDEISVGASGTEISTADGAATADGVDTETITLQLKDDSGNDLAQNGVDVTFASDSGNAILSSTTATTDANGAATITVTNTVAETVNITATVDTDNDGGITPEVAVTNGSPAQVAFTTSGTVNGGNSGTLISATDGMAPSNGLDTETIAIQLKDEFGNNIETAGINITFATTGSAVLSSTTATTNASGIATVTLTNTVEETVSLTATGDLDNDGGTAQTAISNGSPTLVVFSTNGTQKFLLDAIAGTNVNENVAYTSVTPNITGSPIGTLTYTKSGADADTFTIDSETGAVGMAARDFEGPVDDNADNVYEITITATDSDGNTDSEAWTVTVTDADEAASFTIDAIADANVSENVAYNSVTPNITGVPIGSLTYTLGGTDAEDFTIDSGTGVVSMVARDFENPQDNDTDNVYEVTITATDSDGNSDFEDWTVTVTNINSGVAGDTDENGIIDGSEIAGDTDGNGSIDGSEVAGDTDGNGSIDGSEIAGDTDGNGSIDGSEIAGDTDGNGSIDGSEIAGDTDGNGSIDGSEVGGDTDGNGSIDGSEVAGDTDGNGSIDGFEIAGDTDGNGSIDGSEIAGDTDGNGSIDGSEVAGDTDGNGSIDGSEVAGDTDGNGSIDGFEIAGDTDGNGSIDGSEIAGDTDGNGSIDGSEVAGDTDGNGSIDGSEVAGDTDGNGSIDGSEVAGDTDGNGSIDGSEVAGDTDGNGSIDGDDVLIQIGLEGDNPDNTDSTVTVVQLNTITGLTGVLFENEIAYQDYIDANPNAFSSPATLAEVQAMIDTVNTTLGNEKFDSFTFSMYPNPTSSMVNLTFNKGENDFADIKIYNTIGQSVFVSGREIKNNKISLDVSSLPSGIYLLYIKNEEQTVSKKLVID